MLQEHIHVSYRATCMETVDDERQGSLAARTSSVAKNIQRRFFPVQMTDGRVDGGSAAAHGAREVQVRMRYCRLEVAEVRSRPRERPLLERARFGTCGLFRCR